MTEQAGQADSVEISEEDLVRSRLANAQRRLAAEAQRVEELEAAFVGVRRELAGARQQVEHRDEEIRVLRERLGDEPPDDEGLPAPPG